MKGRALITEFTTGGGLASEELSMSLFPESFSMLRFLAGEWEKMGFEVISTLDHRLSWLEKLIKAEFTFVDSSSGYYDSLDHLARKVDHVICVAPETDGMLERCARIFNGIKSSVFHGPAVEALQSLSNKKLLAKYCSQHAILIPPTIFSTVKTLKVVKDTCTSLKVREVIVKPALGAGSENIAIYKDDEEENINTTINPSSGWVIQPLVEGTHHSATFLATNGRVYLLSLNNQLIEKNSGLFYKGGAIPATDSEGKIIQLPESVDSFVRTICQSFSIRGYFGVDFIVSGSRAFVIEVNLRPTTPVTVFDKILPYNPAEFLVDTTNGDIERIEEQELQFIKKNHLVKTAAVFSKVTVSTEQQLDEDQIISAYKNIEAFDAPLFSAGKQHRGHNREEYLYTGMMSMTGENSNEAWKNLGDILGRINEFLE